LHHVIKGTTFAEDALVRLSVGCFLVTALVGCGEPVDLGSVEAEAGELPQLASQSALQLTSEVTATDRETGEQIVSVTRIFARVEADQQQGVVDLQLSPCRFELPALDGWDASLRDSFLRDRARVPALSAGGSIQLEDGLAVLRSDPATFSLGVSDLAGGELPSTADDPRVVDQDGDGDPGVSVLLSLGRIFVAMAATIELDGDVDADGAARGYADIDLGQAVYGDSIWLVDAAQLAAEQEASYDFASTSSFELVPLSDDASCDDVVDAFDE
jgi:hypothetical protein